MESEITQSDALWAARAWFEKNRKQVTMGAGAVLLVGVIVGFISWRSQEKEVAAGEALSAAEVPRPGSRTARVEDLLKVANDYPGSSAGAQALLLAGVNLFVEAKYPEARQQFQRFERDYHDNPLVGEALLGLAASYDAQGQASDAVTAYKNLVDRPSASPAVLPQAKFALARLYEVQNKPELARPLYEELNRANPYDTIGSEAGMRLEELLVKHPELKPKPMVVPTTAPTPMPTPTPAPTAPTAKPAPAAAPTANPGK